ncbi:MAG: N-formylglutamate amidohydrolase [Paracoccaceae bacterium]
MSGEEHSALFPGIVENADAQGRVLLVCEHASNYFPPVFGLLGLDAAAREAHIAWDPGALGLARGLAARLDATLVRAQVSRLVYDCNRAPDAAGAVAERSETWGVPGNRGLSEADRLARTQAVYLPFHATLHDQIARRMARGLRPVVVTVHSFTPVWHGAPRAVEFGVIHDADTALALAVVEAAHKGTTLQTRLNEPYSAADDVTHTLRLQATPYGLTNVMLELRNDLIATDAQQDAMAETLAGVLKSALAKTDVTTARKASA